MNMFYEISEKLRKYKDMMTDEVGAKRINERNKKVICYTSH